MIIPGRFEPPVRTLRVLPQLSVLSFDNRCDGVQSGIKFVTPAQRYDGKSDEILRKRHEVYEAAKASHPERWNGRQTRDWSDIEAIYLNLDKTYEESTVAIVKDPDVRASSLF